MTALFDERVENAIQILWFDRNPSRREEALSMLRAAANLGDGDAYYFLGRCYLGKSYVDPVMEFPLDQPFAFECLRTSLTLESAVGMFGAIHQEGFEPPGNTFVHPPYHTKKEIWDVVSEQAAQGHIFCKYLVANAYYYCTAGEFLDITPSQTGAKQYKRYQYDLGIGAYERIVGNEYRDEGKLAKAIEMYERALAHKDDYAYYCLGKLYTFNGAMPLDLKKALSYLEEGYARLPDDAGFCNLLGEIYFHGGQEVLPDYEQAFILLSKAYFKGSTWGADMLGTCYLNGLGTNINLNMAQKLFDLHPRKPLSAGGLKRLRR